MCARFAKWTTPYNCCRCDFCFAATENREHGGLARQKKHLGVAGSTVSNAFDGSRVNLCLMFTSVSLYCLSARSVYVYSIVPQHHSSISSLTSSSPLTSSEMHTGRAPDQGRRAAHARARTGDWFGGRTSFEGRAASRPLYSGALPDEELIMTLILAKRDNRHSFRTSMFWSSIHRYLNMYCKTIRQNSGLNHPHVLLVIIPSYAH